MECLSDSPLFYRCQVIALVNSCQNKFGLFYHFTWQKKVWAMHSKKISTLIEKSFISTTYQYCLLNNWKPDMVIFPCSVLKRLVVFLALTPKIFLLEMWLSFCSGLLSWFPHSACIGYWYWHLRNSSDIFTNFFHKFLPCIFPVSAIEKENNFLLVQCSLFFSLPVGKETITNIR